MLPRQPIDDSVDVLGGDSVEPPQISERLTFFIGGANCNNVILNKFGFVMFCSTSLRICGAPMKLIAAWRDPLKIFWSVVSRDQVLVVDLPLPPSFSVAPRRLTEESERDEMVDEPELTLAIYEERCLDVVASIVERDQPSISPSPSTVSARNAAHSAKRTNLVPFPERPSFNSEPCLH